MAVLVFQNMKLTVQMLIRKVTILRSEIARVSLILNVA